MGSIPRYRRSPGGGNNKTLQYSCLENPMDRGGWWATVHGVAVLDLTEQAHIQMRTLKAVGYSSFTCPRTDYKYIKQCLYHLQRVLYPKSFQLFLKTLPKKKPLSKGKNRVHIYEPINTDCYNEQ